jgi:hypothetical protein
MHDERPELSLLQPLQGWARLVLAKRLGIQANTDTMRV